MFYCLNTTFSMAFSSLYTVGDTQHTVHEARATRTAIKYVLNLTHLKRRRGSSSRRRRRGNSQMGIIANANQCNRNYVADSMKFDEDKFNGMMGQFNTAQMEIISSTQQRVNWQRIFTRLQLAFTENWTLFSFKKKMLNVAKVDHNEKFLFHSLQYFARRNIFSINYYVMCACTVINSLKLPSWKSVNCRTVFSSTLSRTKCCFTVSLLSCR